MYCFGYTCANLGPFSKVYYQCIVLIFVIAFRQMHTPNFLERQFKINLFGVTQCSNALIKVLCEHCEEKKEERQSYYYVNVRIVLVASILISFQSILLLIRFPPLECSEIMVLLQL
ncbi:hypothetical protein RFI_39993 [Reticulomyxa filosa]|uniref:Uncharacterized protein n=1 Tax=Reticulomyxa filosa TaxID=46433 RepID=X6L8V8_RETFI|nr:hypothetical protein RFI_39993 [Reticulomyxa filosa]|eukprot:ETN97536.1 hypothetical protein RFI_39993 [Reticulomyxa filosa]